MCDRSPRKEKNSYLRSCCLLVLVVLTGVSVGVGAQESSASSSKVLEEIVVTAQRREQGMGDLPVAISAFDAETLAQLQLEDLTDLENFVPSLQVNHEGPHASMTLRGVGSQSINYGGDPGVGFHADGIYVARAKPRFATFYDLERIEVLRGPQGTLYGRNTTGGAINLVYNKPSPEFYGRLTLAALSHDGYEVAGVLNGAVTDRVSGRLSFDQEYNEGWAENAFPGGDDLGDKDNWAVRGQLQIDVSDSVELLLQGDYYESDPGNPNRKFLGGPDGRLTAGQSPPFNGDALVSYSTRKGVSSNDASSPSEFWGLSAKLSIEFENFQFRSISAYRSHVYDEFNQDIDGTDVYFSDLDSLNDIEQYSQEFQLVSNREGKFQWLLGAYYFNEDGEFSSRIFFGFPELRAGGTVETTSYAAYARGEYQISDNLNAFAGVRYSYDEKDMTEFLSIFPFLPRIDRADDDDWDDVTWEIGVDYQYSDESKVFAKIAHGFKSGGFNTSSLQATSFDPEEVLSLEVGYRGLLNAGRTRLSAIVHWSDYKDIQLSTIRDFAVEFNNASDSDIGGVELEITTLASDNLQLSAMASYLHTELGEYITVSQARPELGIQDLKGNEMVNAPEWKFALSATYEFSPADVGGFSVSANYYWEDEVFFTPQNHPQASEDSVGRADANLHYRSNDGRWSAELFVKNITDEKVLSGILIASAAVGSPHTGAWDAPRTYGLRVTMEFE